MSTNIQALIFGLSLLTLSLGCKEDSPPPVDFDPQSQWLLPLDDIIDPGVGKDGIPSIDSPQFSPPSEINPFFDGDLVLGIEVDGELRAYPIPMLNWHEIVNDTINGLPIAITYCPLTGTGIGWLRNIGTRHITFGVSGLLYKSNLMPYDRLTNSTWSQQQLRCVHGHRKGEVPETRTLVMSSFRTWKQSFPNSKIMNANTGFDRRYAEYPYGFYLTDHDLLYFPVQPLDSRLPAKEWVLGVIMDQGTKAYRFNEAADGIEIIQDQIGEQELIVVRSKKHDFIHAYLPDGQASFQPIQDALPAIMEDALGNRYDLLGRVISGPNMGQKLQMPVAMMGFWFSWGAFYPDIEIF